MGDGNRVIEDNFEANRDLDGFVKSPKCGNKSPRNETCLLYAAMTRDLRDADIYPPRVDRVFYGTVIERESI